jgi:hypothetical protein
MIEAGFGVSGRHAWWPKVADEVIEAHGRITLQRHLQNMLFYHKGLGVRKTPLLLYTQRVISHHFYKVAIRK